MWVPAGSGWATHGRVFEGVTFIIIIAVVIPTIAATLRPLWGLDRRRSATHLPLPISTSISLSLRLPKGEPR